MTVPKTLADKLSESYKIYTCNALGDLIREDTEPYHKIDLRHKDLKTWKKKVVPVDFEHDTTSGEKKPRPSPLGYTCMLEPDKWLLLVSKRTHTGQMVNTLIKSGVLKHVSTTASEEYIQGPDKDPVQDLLSLAITDDPVRLNTSIKRYKPRPEKQSKKTTVACSKTGSRNQKVMGVGDLTDTKALQQAFDALRPSDENNLKHFSMVKDYLQATQKESDDMRVTLGEKTQAYETLEKNQEKLEAEAQRAKDLLDSSNKVRRETMLNDVDALLEADPTLQEDFRNGRPRVSESMSNIGMADPVVDMLEKVLIHCSKRFNLERAPQNNHGGGMLNNQERIDARSSGFAAPQHHTNSNEIKIGSTPAQPFSGSRPFIPVSQLNFQ